MREERDTARIELNQVKEELAARDRFIDDLKSKLEEKEKAIANLQTQIADKDKAIENLAALPKQPTVRQLQLFPDPDPEPEPETENTEPPAVNSQPLTVNPEPEPITTTRTLTRGELIKHILEKYSEAKINPQNLTDAVNGKSKKMPEYERLYGFKYVGKIKGQHRFKILN